MHGDKKCSPTGEHFLLWFDNDYLSVLDIHTLLRGDAVRQTNTIQCEGAFSLIRLCRVVFHTGDTCCTVGRNDVWRTCCYYFSPDYLLLLVLNL